GMTGCGGRNLHSSESLCHAHLTAGCVIRDPDKHYFGSWRIIDTLRAPIGRMGSLSLFGRRATSPRQPSAICPYVTPNELNGFRIRPGKITSWGTGTGRIYIFTFPHTSLTIVAKTVDEQKSLAHSALKRKETRMPSRRFDQRALT